MLGQLGTRECNGGFSAVLRGGSLISVALSSDLQQSRGKVFCAKSTASPGARVVICWACSGGSEEASMRGGERWG